MNNSLSLSIIDKAERIVLQQQYQKLIYDTLCYCDKLNGLGDEEDKVEAKRLESVVIEMKYNSLPSNFEELSTNDFAFFYGQFYGMRTGLDLMQSELDDEGL